MSTFRQHLGLQEAAKRFSRGLLKVPAPPENRLGTERLFRTLEGLTPNQLAVHEDSSRRIALCLPRRSGKSYLAAPWFVEEGMRATKYNQTDFFIAPTLEHAKGLLVPHLRELKRTTGLDFEIKNDPAGVFFPSGARMLFRGAKDLDDLGALVGYPTRMVWVDECQDIRDEVLRFIQNKVGPALRDLDGRIVFSGTPGRVAAGLWWEIATGKHTNWSTKHRWSLFDNPHLPPSARDLQTILEQEGYTVETPAFKREYMGLWVEDNSLMVYAYNPALNGDWVYGSELPRDHEWSYVIGVDFGYRPDPSACLCLAYSHTYPDIFIMDEFKRGEITYTELYEQGVRPMYDRYGPCVVVADAANPQAIAEINSRWAIGMQPGVKGNKKTSKAQYVELMNADFRQGLIQVPPESAYARELTQLVWDPDKFPDRKEHPRRDNHLCDAGLYAYLQAKHWAQRPRDRFAPAPADDSIESFWSLAQRGRAGSGERLRDWSNDDDFRPDPFRPGNEPFDLG